MQLSYEWQPEEWREALLLASAGPRRPPKPMMTYMVVGIMAVGALGELVNAVRASSQTQFSGSLLPLLFFAAAVVVAMQVYAYAVSRGRRLGSLASMPVDTQHMMLNEDGWRVSGEENVDAEFQRPWSELREHRTGMRSMILLGEGDTFAALPLRALSATEGGRLQRLLARKVQRIVPV